MGLDPHLHQGKARQINHHLDRSAGAPYVVQRNWLPGLVNIQKAMERSTMLLMGKSTISMAIFHGKMFVHQAGYAEHHFLSFGEIWELLRNIITLKPIAWRHIKYHHIKDVLVKKLIWKLTGTSELFGREIERIDPRKDFLSLPAARQACPPKIRAASTQTPPHEKLSTPWYFSMSVLEKFSLKVREKFSNFQNLVRGHFSFKHFLKFHEVP